MAALMTPGEALQRSFDVAPPVVDEAAPQPQAVAAERRYGVRLGDFGLLLPRDAISEIAEQRPECRLPNTPRWFVGVMNQRGNIVPVFDIATMLDAAQDAPGASAWAVVVGNRDEAVGLYVRNLPQTLRIQASEQLAYNPVSHPLLNPFVSETFSCDDALWLEWDMDGFFTAVGESLSTG